MIFQFQKKGFLSSFLFIGLFLQTFCDDIDLRFDMEQFTHEEVFSKTPHEYTISIDSDWPVRPLSVKIKGPVKEAKLVSDRTLDLSSMETIMKQILKPGMSDEEKMWAVWRFINQHVRANPEAHSTNDAIQLFNSFGGGWCGVWAMTTEATASAAGLKANYWDIGTHAVTMVYYNNAWHSFDAQRQLYFLAPDNKTVAGPKQMSMTPWIISRTVDSKWERYAPGYDNLWPKLARPEDKGGLPVGGSYASTRQKMLIDLRGEEFLERRWLPTTWEWYMGMEKKVASFDEGLEIKSKMLGLGSGIFNYSPDLSNKSYRKGIALEHNLICKSDEGAPQGLRGLRLNNKKGFVIWQIKNPYPYVRAKLKATIFQATKHDRVSVSISVDHGVSFKKLYHSQTTGQNSFEVDFMPEILEGLRHGRPYPYVTGYVNSEGSYSYLVKIELESNRANGKVELMDVAFENIIQVINKSLPAISNGMTKLKFSGKLANNKTGTITYRAEEDIFSNQDPMKGDPLYLRAKIKNNSNKKLENIPIQFFNTFSNKDRVRLGKPIVISAL